MGIKSYRPITPTLRYKMTNTFEQVTTDTPHKPLCVSKKKGSGRNNTGRIMVRHRGGGSRRFIRLIDFKRDKKNISGTVETIEYDPNRSSFIALVKYTDGERRYIITPTDLKVGHTVVSSNSLIDILPGNA